MIQTIEPPPRTAPKALRAFRAPAKMEAIETKVDMSERAWPAGVLWNCPLPPPPRRWRKTDMENGKEKIDKQNQKKANAKTRNRITAEMASDVEPRSFYQSAGGNF